MSFQKFGVITIIAVYLLIFVGGVVRSTGSGMGCPDWPKCFGKWVPPTNIDQLPLNYQEIYGAKLKGEVVFNPVKTWIEYLNRLLGALIGLFVFGTFLLSIKFSKTDKSITLWSATAVLLTGIQGWIGSKVVSSELATYMVSIHMIIAIVIVSILIFVLFKSNFLKNNNTKLAQNGNKKLIWSVFIVTLLQVLLGTQVREKIDIVAKLLGEGLRNNWVENVGFMFIVHRSFSIIVLLLHIALFSHIRKITEKDSIIWKINNWLVLIILFEILTGVTLNYLGFPAFIQPLHLTLATISLGIQSLLIFEFYSKNEIKTSFTK
ncbi:MAG: COX15/CtaA family protein [Bacteroidota bacterium]